MRHQLNQDRGAGRPPPLLAGGEKIQKSTLPPKTRRNPTIYPTSTAKYIHPSKERYTALVRYQKSLKIRVGAHLHHSTVHSILSHTLQPATTAPASHSSRKCKRTLYCMQYISHLLCAVARVEQFLVWLVCGGKCIKLRFIAADSRQSPACCWRIEEVLSNCQLRGFLVPRATKLLLLLLCLILLFNASLLDRPRVSRSEIPAKYMSPRAIARYARGATVGADTRIR